MPVGLFGTASFDPTAGSRAEAFDAKNNAQERRELANSSRWGNADKLQGTAVAPGVGRHLSLISMFDFRHRCPGYGGRDALTYLLASRPEGTWRWAGSWNRDAETAWVELFVRGRSARGFCTLHLCDGDTERVTTTTIVFVRLEGHGAEMKMGHQDARQTIIC